MISLLSHFSILAAAPAEDALLGFWANVAKLIEDHTLIFWLIIGSLALILIGILFVVLKDNKGLRQKQQQHLGGQKSTVFVPVEDPDMGVGVEFLTLKDKIITSQYELEKKIIEKIKNKGPDALGDIVAAYDKAKPEIKLHLKRLVKEERLMERYSQRLHLPDYPQGVLLDAWLLFPDSDTLKEFMEMLASPEVAIQLAGTRFLSAMKDPKSLTLLTAALMCPEHFVPARVAEVFASMGKPGAWILVYLLPQVDDKHKVRVLETIAKIEAPYPPENVSSFLKHEDPSVRAAAALALGAGRMIEGLQPLMMSASDENWQVRVAVVKALGLVGDSRALSVLEALSKDTEGWVAATAKETLGLFGQG